ncbi:hypothetical protein EDC04DRAFT_1214059 [Pisolithus marmoratus]|nr:hypothetical protein EDC04DRAFT_1214059 [Pisolithus marmoratus]
MGLNSASSNDHKWFLPSIGKTNRRATHSNIAHNLHLSISSLDYVVYLGLILNSATAIARVAGLPQHSALSCKQILWNTSPAVHLQDICFERFPDSVDEGSVVPSHFSEHGPQQLVLIQESPTDNSLHTPQGKYEVEVPNFVKQLVSETCSCISHSLTGKQSCSKVRSLTQFLSPVVLPTLVSSRY